MARDDEKVYLYAETAEKLTPVTGCKWMMLFIDIEQNKSTGWQGYDFMVNRLSPKGNKVIVGKNVAGHWQWEPVAETKFAVNNKLELEIRSDILSLGGKDIDIEFKWNDNMQKNGNIMDFYVNGDTTRWTVKFRLFG